MPIMVAWLAVKFLGEQSVKPSRLGGLNLCWGSVLVVAGSYLNRLQKIAERHFSTSRMLVPTPTS